MNVEVVGKLRPPVASDRRLDGGGLSSNAGNSLSIEGSQQLVNKLTGNSFVYASEQICSIRVIRKLICVCLVGHWDWSDCRFIFSLAWQELSLSL